MNIQVTDSQKRTDTTVTSIIIIDDSIMYHPTLIGNKGSVVPPSLRLKQLLGRNYIFSLKV